jgi:hypothetical protein
VDPNPDPYLDPDLDPNLDPKPDPNPDPNPGPNPDPLTRILHYLTCLEPCDLGLGDPVRLAVEGDGLVLGDSGGAGVLCDVGPANLS